MLRSLLAAFVLGCGAGLSSAQNSLIVIVLDDVSWDDVNQVPTPILDTVSVVGRTYTSAYASSVCSPSRYQLAFGRLPHREFIGTALTAVQSDPEDLGAAASSTSIATALRARGYRTGLFGKWHVNNSAFAAKGEAARVHGFETWRAGILGNLTQGDDHYTWNRFDDGKKSTSTTYTTEAIETAFEGWWTTTPGPKLAYVSFAAAHDPHQSAPAWMLPPGHVVGHSARAKFESAIMGLDHTIGQMAAYVDLSKTLVLIVSDNGTPQDVPPPAPTSPGYKLTQYQGGIRVPMWAVGAGVAPGHDASLVQVVDVPATLLEVAGFASPVGFEDSISLAPTFDGTAPGGRPWAFLQRFSPNGGKAPALLIDQWAVVWADGWKVLSHGAIAWAFDLAADPGEQNNLAFTGPGQGKILEAKALRSQVLGPDWPY